MPFICIHDGIFDWRLFQWYTCLLKTVLGFPTWCERCSLNQWKICNDLLYFSGHFRPKTHICLRSKGAAEGCFHLGCLSGIMLVSCLVCWQFTLFQFLVSLTHIENSSLLIPSSTVNDSRYFIKMFAVNGLSVKNHRIKPGSVQFNRMLIFFSNPL